MVDRRSGTLLIPEAVSQGGCRLVEVGRNDTNNHIDNDANNDSNNDPNKETNTKTNTETNNDTNIGPAISAVPPSNPHSPDVLRRLRNLPRAILVDFHGGRFAIT